jgi:dolichol-phosphate mannosyltransferase
MTKFAIVGASGTFVNIGVMALVMRLTGSYDLGSLSGIETSIISNFLLNDLWTFRSRLRGNVLGRLFGYHVSSATSAITTYLVMKILHVVLGVNPLVGQLIGILVGFTLNYLLSSRVIWKRQ